MMYILKENDPLFGQAGSTISTEEFEILSETHQAKFKPGFGINKKSSMPEWQGEGLSVAGTTIPVPPEGDWMDVDLSFVDEDEDEDF